MRRKFFALLTGRIVGHVCPSCGNCIYPEQPFGCSGIFLLLQAGFFDILSRHGMFFNPSRECRMPVDGLMILCCSAAVQVAPSGCAVIGGRKHVFLSDAEFEVVCAVRDAQNNGSGGVRQSEMPEEVYESLKRKGIIERAPVLQLSTNRPYGEAATS